MAGNPVLRPLLWTRAAPQARCSSMNNVLSRRCIFTLSAHSVPNSRPASFDRALLLNTSLTTKETRPWSPTLTRRPFASQARRPYRWSFQIGAEPGIDFSNPHQKASGLDTDNAIQSEIRVIDFSDKQVEQQHLTGASLRSFIEGNDKPEWAACRWIYVNGLDPAVVKTIGELERLHRLAIEDVLDTATPAKVDWYEDHCFMEMPLQKLVRRRADDHPTGDAEVVLRDAPQKRILSKNLAISVEQASIFLTKNNTVITFFEHSGQDVLKPILTRIEAPQTVIRSSNDPWMLVQAVIDAVVDISLPIGKAVDEIFGELESAVLTSPHIAQSRAVYVLRSGLTFLFSNTNAINGLVKMLIDHRSITVPQSPQSMYISAAAQVYLQDVQDHVTTLSSNTHMAIRAAENLTSLIFNMIAASQNESVRQLTLVSSFFLPLTFLTGYFGMNFDPFPAVNEHSDAFFWIIASPIVLTSLALLAVRSRWMRSFIWRRRRRAIDTHIR